MKTKGFSISILIQYIIYPLQVVIFHLIRLVLAILKKISFFSKPRLLRKERYYYVVNDEKRYLQYCKRSADPARVEELLNEKIISKKFY